VADWPTGKPGDFPVGPCFMKFFGPPAYARIYLIDNQLTQSADKLSIQCTGHDVRLVSPSERMTVMTSIHSLAGYRLPESKLFSDENKQPSCRFYDINCKVGLTIRGPISRSRLLKSSYGVSMRSAVSSPSGVWNRAPAEIDCDAFQPLNLTSGGWQHFNDFLRINCPNSPLPSRLRGLGSVVTLSYELRATNSLYSLQLAERSKC